MCCWPGEMVAAGAVSLYCHSSAAVWRPLAAAAVTTTWSGQPQHSAVVLQQCSSLSRPPAATLLQSSAPLVTLHCTAALATPRQVQTTHLALITTVLDIGKHKFGSQDDTSVPPASLSNRIF